MWAFKINYFDNLHWKINFSLAEFVAKIENEENFKNVLNKNEEQSKKEILQLSEILINKVENNCKENKNEHFYMNSPNQHWKRWEGIKNKSTTKVKKKSSTKVGILTLLWILVFLDFH